MIQERNLPSCLFNLIQALSVDRIDYRNQILPLCKRIELLIEEYLLFAPQYSLSRLQAIDVSGQSVSVEFYAIYFIVLSRLSLFDEAKYLWKRNPYNNNNNNTTTINILTAWEVAKSLFQSKYGEALQVIRGMRDQIQNNPILSRLYEDLYRSIVINQIELFGASYRPLSTELVAARLGVEDLEIADVVHQLGWRLNQSGAHMVIVPSDEFLSGQSKAAAISEDFNNSTTQLQHLTSYVHHLEQESLKVDLSSGTATIPPTSGSNNTTNSNTNSIPQAHLSRGRSKG